MYSLLLTVIQLGASASVTFHYIKFGKLISGLVLVTQIRSLLLTPTYFVDPQGCHCEETSLQHYEHSSSTKIFGSVRAQILISEGNPPSLFPEAQARERHGNMCPCGYCVWKASSYFCCCRMQTRLSLLLAIALLILVSCTKTTTSYPKLVSNSILLPLPSEDSYSCYCY